MKPIGSTARMLAVGILFIAAFVVTIPYVGFAQDDERNVIAGRVWCDDDLNGELNGEKIPGVEIIVTPGPKALVLL